MKLNKIIKKENIFFNTNGINNKEKAIEFLIQKVSQNNNLNFKSIRKHVFDREERLSTGIGGRIAIPHARIEKLKNFHIGILISEKDIDFDSLDNNPVNIIALLLSPKNKVKKHISLISKLSYLLTEKEIYKKILNSKKSSNIIKLLK